VTRDNDRPAPLIDPLIPTFYLPSFVLSLSSGLLAPVLPLYAAELAPSYGLVGLVLGGESLGSLVGDVPAGVLLTRLGRKRTMLLGGVTMLLATTVLFWVHSVWVALVCRVLTGLGWALFGVARHAYIASQTDVGNRGRAIALFGGLNRAGRLVGPALGGMVATLYGLRPSFLVYGALCALVPAAVALLMPRARLNRPAERFPSLSAQVLATLRGHRHLLGAAGSGQLLAQAVRAGRGIIIPLYAADVLGLGAGSIGLILSVSSAVDVVLFYPTGVIMDRWGRKTAIVPAFLIQAVSLGLVPLTGTVGGLLAAATLGGLGNGLSSGTMMTLGSDLAPAGARGEFLGVWRLIGDAGASGSPIAIGGIADLVTLQAASWIICGAGLVAVYVFGVLVPETLPGAKPPPMPGR
jgi:MFS family permease